MCQKSAFWLVALASMWGCGGSAFEGQDPATGGTSGAGSGGVSANGGTVALGGAHSTGGLTQQGGTSSSGGNSSGGSSSGGSSSGGSSSGGRGSGGSSSGGRATGGSLGSGGTTVSGGAAGAGAAGGTAGKLGSGGAAGAGAGGMGGVDSRCPARMPAASTTCSVAGLNCRYSYITNCLCTPQTPYSCPQVVPSCTSEPVGTGGLSAFAPELPATGGNSSGVVAPIPPNYSCTCTNGSWSCVVGP